MAHSLRADGFDASEDGTTDGGGTVPTVLGFGWNKSDSQTMQVWNTTDALQASPTSNPAVASSHGMAVRRLTPREAERLQGFPDDFTLVPYRGKPMADGPRYKLLGNSWAVPCVSWIFERMQTVDDILAGFDGSKQGDRSA